MGVSAVWGWGRPNVTFATMIFGLTDTGDLTWSHEVTGGGLAGVSPESAQGIALNHDSTVLWAAITGSGANRGTIRQIDAQTGTTTATVDIDDGDNDTQLTGIEGYPGGGFVVAGIKGGVEKVWKYGSDLALDWETDTSLGIPWCLTIGISDDVFVINEQVATTQIEKLRGSDGVSQATRLLNANDRQYFISGTDSGIIVCSSDVNQPTNMTNVNETLTGQVDFDSVASALSYFVRGDGSVFYVHSSNAATGIQQFDNTASPPTVDWNYATTNPQSGTLTTGIDVHPNGRFGSADGGIYLAQRNTDDNDAHVIFISVDAGDASVTEEWDTKVTIGGNDLDAIYNLVCKPHKNVAT